MTNWVGRVNWRKCFAEIPPCVGMTNWVGSVNWRKCFAEIPPCVGMTNWVGRVNWRECFAEIPPCVGMTKRGEMTNWVELLCRITLRRLLHQFASLGSSLHRNDKKGWNDKLGITLRHYCTEIVSPIRIAGVLSKAALTSVLSFRRKEESQVI
jgi:hypothetical protein